MPDPIAVNSMFSRIARRYDLANHILSAGLDFSWRRTLVRAVRRANPREVLDLATGSGDVAFALRDVLPTPVRITGMDFCVPMLERARAKQNTAGDRYEALNFREGDALALPLPDESVDAITISFGLRNLADRAGGLREMRRVLRPGGRLFVLEFSQPQRWCRAAYFFYLRHLLPRIAAVVTGDRAAYVYLNDTIEQFPGRDALSAEIRAAGFTSVTARPLTLGTVALHEAVR